MKMKFKLAIGLGLVALAAGSSYVLARPHEPKMLVIYQNFADLPAWENEDATAIRATARDVAAARDVAELKALMRESSINGDEASVLINLFASGSERSD
jgi:predicted metalloendopeptidase